MELFSIKIRCTFQLVSTTVITYFLKVIRIMPLFRNFETSNEHGYE